MASDSVISKIIRIVKIILLVAAVILGIAVAALVARARNGSYGWCVLYASKTDASSGTCAYSIGIQSIALVFAAIVALYEIIQIFTSKFHFAFVDLLMIPITAILTFLILVQACVVSVGINRFCVNWDFPSSCHLTTDAGDAIESAEVASWIAFVIWILLTFIVVAGFFISGRKSSGGNKSVVT